MSESQQLVLNLLTEWFVALPSTAGRCDAIAALRLAIVAKNQHRYRLSSWGWRAMREAECDQLKAMHLREASMDAWLQSVATIVRSNTGVAPGSLMARLRSVVSCCAILEHILQNAESSVTPVQIRDWVRAVFRRGLGWYRPDRLADDVTAADVGEFLFTDSEDSDAMSEG